MKNIELDFFPGGVKHCVTFSYDDARIEDERLVPLLNKYGLKGTFHINTDGWQDRFDFLRRYNAEFVDPSRYRELYEGHEISCHLANHPYIHKLPKESLVNEIYLNKSYLEKLCGYPVRGMSYPFGWATDEAERLFSYCGMEYSRNVSDCPYFGLPTNFMQWQPTCHHQDAMQYVDLFYQNEMIPKMKLFYIWGHSYEINSDEKWAYMEELCKSLSNREDTWYATNIEIIDYINAMRALKFTQDLENVYNPSAISVWISVDGKPVEVKPGELKRI